jgi:small subunit ribosomal protein S4
MGDPKNPKKKYVTPSHPWQSGRLEAEKLLVKEYGIKNKKEIWKMDTIRKRFAAQAKRLIADKSKQGEMEKEQLIDKLSRLGLIKKGAEIDDILSIQLKDVLERRLQTLVFKKQLARSIGQARQFIVHHHIIVNGTKVSSPSYLVPVDEEDVLAYSIDSSFMDPEHPEIVKEKQKEVVPDAK